MDELSFVVQSLIDSELDDVLLDLVYEIHSSLKGIPEEQLELNTNGNKARQFSIPYSPLQTTPIDKQICACPHCGQPNIVAMRFAYHLAKCLGVGRRSSRQAKNRIVGQVLSITTLSDDSRSNGEEFQNGDMNTCQPEDGGSCTDSTSSSSVNHRRLNNEDQEYTGDFDQDEDEEEDDWKPRKKKRRTATTNVNLNYGNNNKNKKKKKKDEILLLSQPKSEIISELDFHNCIIPLDKLCPRTQHVVIPLISTPTASNGNDIYLKRRHVSPTLPGQCSSPNVSSHYFVRSPLNLVEDEQSSTTSIIMFKEDNKR